MKGLFLIVTLLSGGLTLLGIYAWLGYSRGVTNSEIERADAIVREVQDNKAPPNFTYWINVYYLKLVKNFGLLMGIVGIIFLLSLVGTYLL